MFSLEAFLDQYYLYISAVLFFVIYTGLLIKSNIDEENLCIEDYLIYTFIVSLLCIVWIFIIPALLIVALGYLYVKSINWISQIYIKRNRTK